MTRFVGAQAASILLCGIAWAAPGDHIKLGELELTPSVGFQFAYNSNVYLLEEDPEPGYSLTVSPKLDLQGEKPDWMVRAGVGYAPKKFIDPDPKDEANVQNLDRWNELNANLSFDVLRRSILGFRAQDVFQITNTPGEFETSDANANIRAISNDLKGGVLVRPGSAIQIGALGTFGIDDYRVPPEFAERTTELNFNNRASYGPGLEASWQFLPRTSVVLAGGVTWNRWANNLVRAAGPDVEAEGLAYGEYLGKPDSIHWRSTLALKGQVTEKVSTEISLGYGQGYYDEESVLTSAQAVALGESSPELELAGTEQNAESFARDLTSFGEGLLMSLQVGWRPAERHALNVGYRKDFLDAVFTNYVTYSYLFGKYEGLLADRFKLQGELTWRLDAYHGEVARKDHNFGAKLGGVYTVTRFLDVNASASWRARDCAQELCANGAFVTTQYDDFGLGLGATLSY